MEGNAARRPLLVLAGSVPFLPSSTRVLIVAHLLRDSTLGSSTSAGRVNWFAGRNTKSKSRGKLLAVLSPTVSVRNLMSPPMFLPNGSWTTASFEQTSRLCEILKQVGPIFALFSQIVKIGADKTSCSDSSSQHSSPWSHQTAAIRVSAVLFSRRSFFPQTLVASGAFRCT